MTDPEARAGATESFTVPAGWIVVGYGLAHVDPQDPMTALDRRDRLDRRGGDIAKSLASHPEFAAAVQRLKDRFAGEIQAVRASGDLHDPERGPALLDELNPAMIEVANTIGPDKILTEERLSFIVNQLFPNEARKVPLSNIQPVRLNANVGDQILPMKLHPGEIAMFFTSASAEDRKAYDDLIRAMQVALRHPVNTGGRQRRTDQAKRPGKTDPRVVSRLRQQHRTPEDIALILAAVYPGDAWAPEGSGESDRTVYSRSDGLRKRINRYADDGDRMLSDPGAVSEGL
jgi:hypothetical protein